MSYKSNFGLLLLPAIIFVMISSLVFASPNSVDLNSAKRYRFHAEHKQIQSLERMVPGIIVDEATTAEDAVVWATPEGLANLYSAGFAPIEAPLPSTPDWWTTYPTAQQVTDSLVALAARHPMTARIDTIGRSVNGRPLVAISVGANVTRTDYLNRPGIMLIGTMHGNEKAGTPLLMNFAEWLLDSAQADPRIARLMSECRIHILPLMNPDGYTSNVRQNAGGIDLNRSFPCKTTTDSLDSPTGRAPETQAVMAWSHTTMPLLALNFHTGTVVANYPYDNDLDVQAKWSFPQQPDKNWFIAAADSYAVHNTTMWANNTAPFVHGMVNGVYWYQALGTLQDYHLRYLNCRHVTIEISTQQPPPTTALPGLWNENKNSILAFCSLIWQGIDYTITGTPTITSNTFGDLYKPQPKYLRLGNTMTWRFLLPTGRFYLHINRPFNGSSWNSFKCPYLYTDPYRTEILPATIRTVTSSLCSYNLFEGINSFALGVYLPFNAFQPVLDSCLISPFEDIPGSWFHVASWGWWSEFIPVGADSFGAFSERNWLLKDIRPNGIYLPLVPGFFVADGPCVTAGIIHHQPFSNTPIPGTGTGLQFTTTGRSGGGFADSPTGNYSNNVNSTFTFPTDTLEFHTWRNDAAFMRYSFSYRGNMEMGYDYWVVFVKQDSSAFIPVDTLSGIVNNWTMWYHDFPLIPGNHTSQIRIQVVTDGSIVRDGFTMDDLTCSMTQFFDGTAAPEAITRLPKSFSLTTYPNPFNSTTRITLTLPNDALTKIALYNVLGQEVILLKNEWMKAGFHTVLLNGERLSSGVYYILAEQGGQVRTQKIALIK